MVDYPKYAAKQAARERFTGLWAATTTPFGAAGELDEAALRRDLDRLTGRLRRRALRMVRPRVRQRGHRRVAVRHQLLGDGADGRPDRPAGNDRERGGDQGRAPACAVPGAAGPVRGPDPGLLPARGDLA